MSAVKLAPAPALKSLPDPTIDDLRFRKLLSDEDWRGLPAAVRRRFSKRLTEGNTVTYTGIVTQNFHSRCGWCLAQITRLIGAPLPLGNAVGLPAIVTVTEDLRTGGQNWTRLYVRHGKFPQVIHSSKRFCGPTGLEEYVGCGVSMALDVTATDDSIFFNSTGYFLHAGPFRIKLPGWLTPGSLRVGHTDLDHGRFVFSLKISHPAFGLLIEQSATFRESAS